jgi:hypothetical protein
MADSAEGAGEEKKSKTVFVKANEHIHEESYHAKGDIFEIEAARAKALGSLVTKVNAKVIDGKLTEV